MLRAREITKFIELGISRSHVRKEGPWRVFTKANEAVDLRKAGTPTIQCADGLRAAIILERNHGIKIVAREAHQPAKQFGCYKWEVASNHDYPFSFRRCQRTMNAAQRSPLVMNVRNIVE